MITTNIDLSRIIPSMFLTSTKDNLKDNINHIIFFKGKVKHIFLFRDLLIFLSEIVEARFYKPELNIFLDPVITCEDNLLRMECFSSDTSIYCRIDIFKEMFDDYLNIYRGTTNVNFNKDFLETVIELKTNSEVIFEVGKEKITLNVNDKKISENKVKLPERWVRGFLESQAMYRKSKKVFELTSMAAKKFIADCSTSMKDKKYFLILKNGLIEFLSTKPRVQEFIEVQGLSRLSLIKKLLPHITGLSIYFVKETDATLWLVKTKYANITFAISSSIKNGFSGEGESLRSISLNRNELLDDIAIEKIISMKVFTIKELSNCLEISEEETIPIIDELAVSGIIGYDCVAENFFYRVLPFSDGKNPRFKDSKELLKKSNVDLKEIINSDKGIEAKGVVQGNTDRYNVAIFINKNGYIENGNCECEWYKKNDLKRGPCKHLLALRLFSETCI